MIGYILKTFSFRGELNAQEYKKRYALDLFILIFLFYLWIASFIYFLPSLLDHIMGIYVFNTPLIKIVTIFVIIFGFFLFGLNRCSLTYRRLKYLKMNPRLSLISLSFPLSMAFEYMLFQDKQI